MHHIKSGCIFLTSFYTENALAMADHTHTNAIILLRLGLSCVLHVSLFRRFASFVWPILLEKKKVGPILYRLGRRWPRPHEIRSISLFSSSIGQTKEAVHRIKEKKKRFSSPPLGNVSVIVHSLVLDT